MADLVSAEDLLAKMRAGVKETYEIKMRQLIIPVRMLSLDERLDIRNRMIRENAKMGGDEVFLASITQKEILKQASSLKDGTGGFPERFFNSLELDEVIYLFNEYQKVCDQVNPALEQIQPEQFKLLVEAAKKNSLSANDLSLAQLRAVFISWQDLIQRLDIQNSQPDNSFGGPQ